jgi:hypothetical protein
MGFSRQFYQAIGSGDIEERLMASLSMDGILAYPQPSSQHGEVKVWDEHRLASIAARMEAIRPWTSSNAGWWPGRKTSQGYRFTGIYHV